MITNPHAQRILCFGDSNTWGQRPDVKERYGVDIRWTALLQNQLGERYEIIEEGLNSRTTNLEFSRKPGRKGDTYFRPCVESQYPLDLIVIMLGTNDVKIEYGPRQPGEISQAIQNDYIFVVRELVKSRGKTPKIAIVSPIAINLQSPQAAAKYTGIYNEQSAGVIQNLPTSLQTMATANDCYFADAATVAQPGEDGIHIDAAGHKALAGLLAQKITGEWLA